MKRIPLTNSNQTTLIDDEDVFVVSKHRWYLLKTTSGHCYVRSCGSNKIFLHRYLLGLKNGDKRIVDHRDFNPLNNQKSNLRICTTRQNNQHTRPRPHSSKYKGVSHINHWVANITHNSKMIHLGIFKSEKEAARAYNKKAKELFGEFAVLNNV